MPVFSSKSERRIICQLQKENQTKMHKQEKKKIIFLQLIHLHHSFIIEIKQKDCFVLSDNLAQKEAEEKRWTQSCLYLNKAFLWVNNVH